MSVHKYSSRGRTRQPKNLKLAVSPIAASSSAASHYAQYKASGSVTVVTASTDLSDTLAGAADGTNGYDTQNQDYLHLCVRTTGSTGSVIDVYAFNKQFGQWGRLKTHQRTDQASLHASMLNVQVSGSPSSTHYVVVPIHGIDRVGFVCSNTQDVILYAAGSTL
tara:strand:- start:2873 stop:3364 length:492 start_codon:yes stop_codon:yes gene_type:complete